MSNFIYNLNGDVLVFGVNEYGQLGLGHDDNIYIPVLLTTDKNIKDISCNENHTIIYKDNGDVLVFGYNQCGELGLGNNHNVYTPTLLMNDNNIRNIICGEHYTIIYKDNGDVLVFGDNNYGQLGLGLYPGCVDSPILLMNDKSIKNIICGKLHTIIYKNTGDILVFGDNRYGQLGLDYQYNDNIDTDVNVPTLLMTDKIFRDIICGEYHTIIYRDNGDILVFGSNEFGQLGLNNNNKYTNINILTLLMNDKNIRNITCGRQHTIIYKDNGDVLVFGSNYYGQLGLSRQKDSKIHILSVSK